MARQLLIHNALRREGVNRGQLVVRLCKLAGQDEDKQAAVMACGELVKIIDMNTQQTNR